jgi:hypothetical protein
MRRTISIVGAVFLLLLVTAAPALAAPAPRIHDSGSVNYAYAFSSSCSGTTCTDTYINVFTATLDNGDTENVVCVDIFTYPVRGRGGYTDTYGCGPASSFTIASDFSSATLGTTTITDATTCTSRRCDPTTITVSGTFTAAGAASTYSYRQSNKYPDCTERFSVRGTSVPATFQGTVNGTSITAEGAMGKERYSFSSTCVYGPA